MMSSLFFFKPPIYSSEKSIYNHSVNLPSHLNNPISTTYPFSSCQLDPTAFLQWICLVPRLQPKIRELKFNLQPSENPLFHAFFTHYLSTLDIKQTHSTWHERILLIALSEPKCLFLVVISPRTLLFLRKQVKGKILRKSSYFSK